MRDGRSYVTRAVRAQQNGKVIFIMLCSFQKPEPWQAVCQLPPPHVPKPDDCEFIYERSVRLINSPNVDDRVRVYHQEYISVSQQ